MYSKVKVNPNNWQEKGY